MVVEILSSFFKSNVVQCRVFLFQFKLPRLKNQKIKLCHISH